MGVTAGSARAGLGRISLLVGWVPLLALVPVALFAPGIPPSYRYVPLVASVLFLGMPHGAVDYVALPRARTGRVDVPGAAAVGGLYLVLGSSYLLLWFLAPVLAATIFILLTWFHWGQGDLYALKRLFGTDHVDDRLGAVLTVVVRGGAPMLVPLVGFPDRYREVVATFVEPFGGNTEAWWVFETGPRLALGGAFAAVTLFALVRGYPGTRSGDSHNGADTTRLPIDRGAVHGWALDAAETCLLWAYFLLVPPVLAVGVYFCLWHSVRHIARVVLLDDRNIDALARRQWVSVAKRFGLEAAAPTAFALLLVGALWVASPGSVKSLSNATGLYLVGIAVLTLPHTAIVVWLDRKQGIWT
jgi:Brp/Blh family beta-carotene 15,15'-monooxygenase